MKYRIRESTPGVYVVEESREGMPWARVGSSRSSLLEAEQELTKVIEEYREREAFFARRAAGEDIIKVVEV